jgi:hypothetical protein
MQPPPKEPRSGNEASATKSSRSEEVRQVIEGYVDDLREIIKKLRRQLH